MLPFLSHRRTSVESILAQLRRPNKLIRKEKEFVCCRKNKEIGPVSGSGRRGPPGAPGLDWAELERLLEEKRQSSHKWRGPNFTKPF